MANRSASLPVPFPTFHRAAIFRLALFCLLLGAMGTPEAAGAAAGKYLAYVGTYNVRGSKGIYAYNFNPANGQLTALGLKAEVANPSFLTVAKDQPFLYAVSEIDDYHGRHSGNVIAYRADRETGQLTWLNETSSIGEGPCHLSIDKTGKFVLTANYDSGSVAVFPLLPDGKLGKVSAFVQHLGASVNPDRQKGPHAHFFETSADNRFAIAADLGLDKLLVYKFDAANGTISPSVPPDASVTGGSGPRHFVFHPSQRYLYLLNEMGSSVTAFAYDAQQGTLQQKQTISALPKDFKGSSDAAEIQIDAKGKFLYASVRGADIISVFRINPTDGVLTQIQTVPSGGKTPRFFTLDPTGKFLLAANQASDNIVTFRISSKTGKLTKTSVAARAISPVCLVFLEVK